MNLEKLAAYASGGKPMEYIYVIGVEEVHRLKAIRISTPPELRAAKVGRSNDPPERCCEFQTGNAADLSVMYTHPGDQILEAALHRMFERYRIRARSEWFDFGEDHPVDVVAEAIALVNPTLTEVRDRRRTVEAARRAERLSLLRAQLLS